MTGPSRGIIWIIAGIFGAWMVFSWVEDPAPIAHRVIEPDEMVHVPAGSVRVGGRTFDLPAFYIDRFEVTEAEWEVYAAATGRSELPYWKRLRRNPDYPVRYVTWQDADSFARHRHKRLPSNLQWERASQGRGGKIFPWGDAWLPAANTFEIWENRIEEQGVTRVAIFELGRSEVGTYDMIGNVSEWTSSAGAEELHRAMTGHGAELAEAATHRLVRGGSFATPIRGGTGLESLEATSTRSWDIGFRCVAEEADILVHDRVLQLARQLGHSRPPFCWTRRAAAARELVGIGAPALPGLEAALESGVDGAWRERIESVVRTIRREK